VAGHAKYKYLRPLRALDISASPERAFVYIELTGPPPFLPGALLTHL
jgi:hypothetical protein